MNQPSHPTNQMNRALSRGKIVSTIGAVLCLALAPAANAQTTPGSVLYTPNVDLTTLSQNTFAGTVGGIFLTSTTTSSQVNYLGYADPTGAPLQISHLVTLWDNSTGNIIASATVAAGNAAPLVDGYRWVQLSTTLTLNANSYYVIGAQVDGVHDLWGDFISNNSPDNGNNGQISWNSQYVQASPGYEFSRAGRYDSAGAYPNEPAFQSGSDAIYPAANLGFDVVPEPGSFGLVAVGAAVFIVYRLKDKARKSLV